MATSSGAGRAALLIEGVASTAIFVVGLRELVRLPWAAVQEYQSLIFAVTAVYLPLVVLWLRRRPVDFLERTMGAALHGVLVAALTALVIFPPYLLLAHGWQKLVAGEALAGGTLLWPSGTLVAAQVLLISFPEEFFFRGYLQTTLDRVFPTPWRVFGAKLGPGWLLTAALFALSHTIIYYQWWHFAIFFPGLLFGYLRARTNGLVAPTLFHALSNLVMWGVNMNYG